MTKPLSFVQLRFLICQEPAIFLALSSPTCYKGMEHFVCYASPFRTWGQYWIIRQCHCYLCVLGNSLAAWCVYLLWPDTNRNFSLPLFDNVIHLEINELGWIVGVPHHLFCWRISHIGWFWCSVLYARCRQHGNTNRFLDRHWTHLKALRMPVERFSYRCGQGVRLAGLFKWWAQYVGQCWSHSCNTVGQTGQRVKASRAHEI